MMINPFFSSHLVYFSSALKISLKVSPRKVYTREKIKTWRECPT